MKHFVGGAAIGLLFALIKIPQNKKAKEMSDLEFVMYVLAHFFVSGVFGLAAWGLIP